MNKPRDLHIKIREGFSKRLINTLKKRGYTSTKAYAGVSAKAISEALGCSFTIARKYLAGQTLPENKTMEKISNWLAVDSWWLLYGDKNQEHEETLDKELLNDILIQAKDILIEHQHNWEYIIKNIFNIYDSIYYLEGPLDNKKKSIQLMLEFFKNSLDAVNNNC